MSYSDSVAELSLTRIYGWHGVQAHHDHLERKPWVWQIFSLIGNLGSPPISPAVITLVERKVAFINQTHLQIRADSPPEVVHTFFQSGHFFRDWNQFVTNPKLQIDYKGIIETSSDHFSATLFDCYYQTENLTPLVVAPKKASIDLVEWANNHREGIAEEIKGHGALVFHGFILTQEIFPKAFEAVTGKPPAPYKGDTPRHEVKENIYHSTAVADGQYIPLHQENSAGLRDSMPEFIAFYCATPPLKGTGQTLLGDAARITHSIQQQAPDIWELLATKELTYSARYLPSNTWYTNWIQRLNPSHATVKRYFGTEDPSEIQNICTKNRCSYRWDNGWAIVSHHKIPATISAYGTTLFCNQIHVDKFSPALCGGLFYYLVARLFLYPTLQSTPYDVQFEDGTPLTTDIGTRLLTILKKHAIARDWEANDLMVLNNKTMMHGKAPHKGERRILVAMA